jgi:hypothetical protein
VCVHLLRASIHLQVEKIPSKYKLQRYTISSRKDLHVFRGKDGVTKSYRRKMLLTKIMKVVRQACISKAWYDKAMDVLDELDGVLCRFEPDIGCNESCDVSDDEENQVIRFNFLNDILFGTYEYAWSHIIFTRKEK